jgi:DNA primase catalytic core
MAMIPDDDLDKMKRSIDLAAVIRSRGVELKPQGGDLVGRCPFHDDQSPSLRVTPGKGLWRCMSSACGATGNVIQFVQKFDGVSFRHAYELLKNGAAFTGAPTCAPVKKGTIPRLASPIAADADDQAALRQVLDYYHERLKENPAALDYLKKRGLCSEELITTFKIGFVDRTLGLRLPHNNRKEGAALRERLTRLGLLRDTGHEHLRGRIVFPVVAENGEIGTVYGRAIDDGGKHERHLFLPGPQRGLFNPAALRSAEVILCEGIIDALTFWAAGFKYVTTGYSAKALSEEMLAALIQAKVQRVFIAFDRDEAGDKGALEVAEQLMARGIECRRVLFPHGQDANSYALAVQPAAKSLGVLLNAAAWMGKGKVSIDESATTTRHHGSGILPPATSSYVTPAPSSLAAKAASVAAAGAREPVPPAWSNEAAREEEKDAAATTPRQPDAKASVGAGSATLPTLLLRQGGEYWFLEVDNREYRLAGLEKTVGTEALKLTLRLKVGDRFHLDAIDLTRDADRRRFVERGAEETGLLPELLRRDFGKLLLAVEVTQLELRRAAEKTTGLGEKTPALSAQDKERALALLRDPRLWELISEHAAACGIAGERVNMLVCYLGTVSRLLDRPLAIVIQSSSAAGKTTVMDASLAFVPPSCRIKYSAMTGQSLFYMGGADLAHKILAIVEEEGAEKASYALKLLQSEGELRIASTGKDPHTGRMETQEYHVQGPTMIFLTTTSHTLDEELQNRCLILTVDESREQTERIHALQREARTEVGLARKVKREELLSLHRAAQSLLVPLPVYNPYSSQLRFLSTQLRTRRDHEKYLLLIDSLALLFQHQRERKIVAGRECVVATLDDIARANALAHEVLGRGLDDMPPQTRRLLALIQQMQRERAKNGGEGGLWRRRDLRDFTGWGDTQLKIHLQRLVELEYVSMSRDPEHLNGQIYEMMFDGEVTAQRPHLSGLIDVEALGRADNDRRREGSGTLPHDYEKNRSGQNEGRSGVGRPLVGGQSGVGRGAKNAQSSSEKHVSETPLRENARPEGGAGREGVVVAAS